MTNAQRRRYELLYESCLTRPNRRATVNALTKKIRANRKRYEKVGRAVGVPWYVVGIIHSLEAGGDFTRHLHNGDPLSARTVHVPAGRPKAGRPPFTWEQSAIDALRGRGLGAWKDWSVPGTLYQLERTTASATGTTTRTSPRRTSGASRTTTRAGSTSPTGASRRRLSRSRSAQRSC